MSKQRFQYWIPLAGFVIALLLHFWNIGVPAQLVSDEVSFVPDGWDYVQHQAYFDPHPPLGKLILGISMQAFGLTPIVWRGVNAFEAALLVPLAWWIVWRLTRRQSAATIVVILLLLDGLTLVDARLGMINIPFLLAACLAIAAILRALDTHHPRWWLMLAGCAIGAAVSTKWLAGMLVVPTILLWFRPAWFGQQRQSPDSRRGKFESILWLIGWPTIIYWLVFVMHFLWLEIPQDFIGTNINMLRYHLSVPSSGDPNAQPWWGWILAWRPFPYWTEINDRSISAIRSLPNPWLWWSGMALFVVGLVRDWRQPIRRWLLLCLLCAWLPFAGIQRVMYSYHMLTFDVALLMYVAVVVGDWWPRKKTPVIVYLVLATIVFIWFVPWFLRLPLSATATHWREWLPTWQIR